MIKKIFLLYFIINLFNNSFAVKTYEIIASVNNYPITQVDVENELKILSILNKKQVSYFAIDMALNNLIEEKIKKNEIKKENIKINNKLIDQYFYRLLKNLDLEENKINENLVFLIKEKITTDQLWNNLILQKYGWKININMNEIEQRLKNKNNKKINTVKIKEDLIIEEKNKKLSVFSRYHLNMLKTQSLIKFSK